MNDLKGYRLTPCGIVFERALTEAEHDALGRRVAAHVNGAAWAIGDWLLVIVTCRGDDREGVYDRAHELTGRSYESLSQYARVSAAFDHDERNPRIPWTLYREMMRLPKKDRPRTIALILENGWNRAGLTNYINLRLDEDNALHQGAHTSGLLVARRGRMGWRGRQQGVAPRRDIQCPECGHVFGVRRKGLTETPIEATPRPITH